MPSIGSTKLIQLLLTFSKKEFQSFVEIVENPTYNKVKSLIRIAKYLQLNNPHDLLFHQKESFLLIFHLFE